jgi:enamine deaminase RidA (YjgF/YER057c/UK114 family)
VRDATFTHRWQASSSATPDFCGQSRRLDPFVGGFVGSLQSGSVARGLSEPEKSERSMTAKTPEERIAELGLALPPPARAVANYAPWVITGNLVMTSGNLPWRDGKLAYVGKIGREISGDDGYKSCQLSCLNAVAQIKQAVGELTKVKRIVRLEGVLGVDEAYKEHPKCLDGASDLINTAFEEKGRHTRMIYTNPVMPLDCTSLVVLFAEIG